MVRRGVGRNRSCTYTAASCCQKLSRSAASLGRVAVEAEVLRVEQRPTRDERLERGKHIGAVQRQGERVVAHVERVVVGAEPDVVPAAHMDGVLGHLIAVHVLRARKKQRAAERPCVGNLHLRDVGLRSPRSRLTRRLELGFQEQTRPDRTTQARHDRHALIVEGLEVRRRLAQQRALRRRCCSHSFARSCPGR